MIYKIIEKTTEKTIATIDEDEINILDNIRFELIKEEKEDGTGNKRIIDGSFRRSNRGNERSSE